MDDVLGPCPCTGFEGPKPLAETAASSRVISLDTAAAHLPGATGRPMRRLNRFDTDRRWMDGRDESPWYPTMRLFRQTEPSGWAGVIVRVADALRQTARDIQSHP